MTKLTTKRGPAISLPGPNRVYVGEPGPQQWTPSKHAGRRGLYGLLKLVKPPKPKPQKPKRKPK